MYNTHTSTHIQNVLDRKKNAQLDISFRIDKTIAFEIIEIRTLIIEKLLQNVYMPN